MHRLLTRTLILLMLIAPAATLADEPAAKDPVDELSRKTFENWAKMYYSAGALGAKKASASCAGSMAGGMVKLEAKGTYVWDGKKGSLNWNNAMLAGSFEQQGLGAGTFDGNFDTSTFLVKNKGLTLTAKKTETGVEIAMSGKSAAGYTGARFDAGGVLTAILLEPETPMGKIKVEVTFTYEKLGELYRLTSWVANVDLGPQGKVVDTTTITWTKVGDYDVYEKLACSATTGGQAAGTKTVVISDWKFNDDVTVEAAADDDGDDDDDDNGNDDDDGDGEDEDEDEDEDDDK